ncbi:MAG: helix-turn-helix transcriptional regulator [Clostridia bacterium]|nr:helix-turn-helix transcriptional regulator [Clostridia bacterium]
MKDKNMNNPIDFRIVGNRIQKYRLENKLTQDELADRINSSQTYLSEVEAGKHRLFFDTVVSITQALNISVDKLIADFDDSNNESNLQEILNEIRGMSAKQLELLRDNINTLKKLD